MLAEDLKGIDELAEECTDEYFETNPHVADIELADL